MLSGPGDLLSLNAWTILINYFRLTNCVTDHARKNLLTKVFLEFTLASCNFCSKVTTHCTKVAVKGVTYFFWVSYVNIINGQFRNISIIFSFR